MSPVSIPKRVSEVLWLGSLGNHRYRWLVSIPKRVSEVLWLEFLFNIEGSLIPRVSIPKRVSEVLWLTISAIRPDHAFLSFNP